MAVQSSALEINLPVTEAGTSRRCTLAIVLMSAVLWVDSPYPALLKRYHAGTQIKATGATMVSGRQRSSSRTCRIDLIAHSHLVLRCCPGAKLQNSSVYAD